MMARYITLILFLTLMLTSGCTTISAPPTPMPPTPMADLDLNPNGIIFSTAQTEDSLDAISRDITGAWMPAPSDVAMLEADLPAFLQNAQNDWLRPEPPIWERVPEYMRQYLGIVEGGEEIIYANFFCATNGDTWRDQFVMVLDGGDCYFQIRYNPKTREFFNFSVNGES